ncbi:MAG: XdhC family protein [Kiloniellaceae bacterium]
MKRVIFESLQAARAGKRPVALVTNLDSGRQALLDGAEITGDLTLGRVVLDRARRAVVEDRSGALDGTSLFVHVFNPPLRMIVVGAVHIAQALVPMAALAGYEVIVVDPRRAWASEARFPDVTLSTDWPDEALKALKPDRRTAVLTLTHDPKLDDPALAEALRSPAFYIGALGSSRTHAKRLARLRELGFSEDDFARIHGPVGLAIGAQSPAEIALSILAEATQVRYGAPPLVRQEAAQ